MRYQKHRGFTMVEVLVALVVLAVGLLGVATMQTIAIQQSKNASLRSVATYLAVDMADRMRANRIGWQVDNAYIATETDMGSASPKCSGADAVACTPAQMAKYDIWEWKQLLTQNLPEGKGTIERPDADANTFVVTVKWSDKVRQTGADGPADTAESTVVFEFQP